MSVEIGSLVMPNPLGTGPGPWLNVEDQKDKYVRVKAGAAATVQIEGAIDQADPFSIGSAVVNTSAWFSVPDTVRYLRANLTAYSSGTPVAQVAGKAG